MAAITVTVTTIDGATPPNSLQALDTLHIVGMTSSDNLTTGTAVIQVCRKEGRGHGAVDKIERWVTSQSYATVLAAVNAADAEAGAQLLTERVTSFATIDDDTYPTTKAVKDSFQPIWYAANTGTDTYAITLTGVVPTAYYAGMTIHTIFANANTGAATINVNALGAKAIAKDVSTALAANDIVVGKVYELRYDGTRFQVDVADVSKEATANKATTFGTINDTKFPTVEAVVEVAQPIWFVAATGTDTYAATLSGIVPTAYYTGMMIKATFQNANTGASTVNVNALGAKGIKKGTGGVTDLAGADLVVTKIYTLIYDGTAFQIDL